MKRIAANGIISLLLDMVTSITVAWIAALADQAQYERRVPDREACGFGVHVVQPSAHS